MTKNIINIADARTHSNARGEPFGSAVAGILAQFKR